jgi:hypothetical protein
VNFENVVKQGILCTKGKILRLYNTEVMVYLEGARSSEDVPIMKYGPKKKSV